MSFRSWLGCSAASEPETRLSDDVRPHALIRFAIRRRDVGFVEFRDTRGLLSVVREGPNVVQGLQSLDLPDDADGILLVYPASDGFLGASHTCALVNRAGESWWVVPTPDATPVEWSDFCERYPQGVGHLPCPPLELAAARRYVQGSAVVDVHHGSNTPLTWVIAAAASEIIDFAQWRTNYPADDRPAPRVAGMSRAQVMTEAEEDEVRRRLGSAVSSPFGFFDSIYG